jgi:succinoglycan biosynthesis transport protein ExoP
MDGASFLVILKESSLNVDVRDLDQSARIYQDRQGAIRYLRAFRRQWLLIAVLVIITVSVTVAITLTAPKKYEATADVTVSAVDAGGDLQGFTNVFKQPSDGSSAVVGAARVMNAPRVREQAFNKLGTSKNISLSATPLSQADIIAATATARSSTLAADAANAFARAFVQQRNDKFQGELRRKIDSLTKRIALIPASQRAINPQYAALQGEVATLSGYLDDGDPSVSVTKAADPPASASSPRPKLSIAVAFIAALLLGCGAAIAREFFNPRLSDEDELRLTHRLPILARIPRLRDRVVREYLSGRGVLPSDAWKGYRTLRAVLANAGDDGGYPRSILITSAMPGDGKTMAAVNLAISLAAADLRVILVDGDFHRPMISSIFNVTAKRDGLTRLLAGEDAVDSVLVPAPSHAGLRLLLGTREHAHHLHVLDTDRLRGMLSDLEREADVVVIDSPPVPEVAEALAMADAVEAVLISVRLGYTRRDRLELLRELLARRGVAPVGFIVSSRTRPESLESYYDYAGEPPAPPSRESALVAKLSRAKAIRAANR